MKEQKAYKKIFFDCTYLRNAHTGVDVYFLSLIKYLVEIDTKNQYIILLDSRYNQTYLLQQLNGHSNYTVRSIYSPLPLQVIYSAFFIPFYLLFKKIDVYHNPYFFGPLIKIFNRSTKIVITVHDLYHHTIPGLMDKKLNLVFKFFADRAIKSADEVIVISTQTKNDLLSYLNIPLNRVNLIYQALNDKFSSQRIVYANIEKLGLVSGRYILTVGKVLPSKGLADLIKAFEILVKKNNAVEIKLVSAGIANDPYVKEIEQLIESLDISQQTINLLGYVSDDELSALYANASIVVVPSYYEGFGLPLLEAMKFGKPLVVREASSLTEIVGDAGILFKTVEELADALNLLLTDSAKRRNLISEGYERLEFFSWKTTAQRTMEVYLK